ncbi:replication factor A3 [Cryptococcus deuterogattii 99/473]|uniref:Replication factor A3 n=1 Tax=Cryptococcus deuterogattii Ram5 TaxID=1296110 RepID=A0A0D0TU25_9TREE|nr:replication factor A3 [Cryptococcus deuterogattii LA55]KIR32702.1 replication factor A3 [Cryptococcus deuterogattii MMRL2647]KIR39368.1 replication factor A3 [Cryptococcus deuterogattii Ram5]KIR71031.1 replication factor A3 [Cryptococcus deuterogattii CA1014]KIR94791.1 replication factor A3 [Cryptococcus deuterogattii CBS 10090]KIS00686.1 replication factor A3 [Cryptococcus deuterogattii 2001/935-1]KIY54629.1 replication factor A3 [Cryptococcus deuterogattii 99/473]
MSRLGPEPRINSKHLSEHRGEIVRLIAKVATLSGDTATLETSDGGTIGIHLPRDMHIADQYVEIIGTVKEDLTIRAHTHIGLGNNLGQCNLAIYLRAVNSVIEFSHSPIGQGVLN